MKEPISIKKTFALVLGKLEQPVITLYQLGVYACPLLLTKKPRTQSIDVKDFPNYQDLALLINSLLEDGILQIKQDHIFSILGKTKASPEEIICTIDPFAYISHLSAMAHHGLTDRLSKTIFLSSPPTKLWKQFALEQMQKDYGKLFSSFWESDLPRLIKIQLKKIDKMNINYYSSTHLGAFKSIKDSMMRVSTIGRTFLDMIREPQLCGGIYHVIDIYKEHAKVYLNLIVDEIERHGDKIDKVRGGFLLEEICGLQHNTINTWQQKYVQRGGSRKLDPTGEYSPNFSARWCLSLNVEGLKDR